MRSKILHFLNGDSTLSVFRKAKISGDVAVMRETFCFWPVLSIDDPQFWEIRRANFKKHYFVERSDYEEKILDELQKVKAPYDEIAIWYEYDVYCHINMLFLVAWCTRHTKAKLSLVYSEKGMGRHDPSDYLDLVKKRVDLDQENIDQCIRLWNGVVDQNLQDISEKDINGFPNMKLALEAFQKQFHRTEELGPIEKTIIKYLEGQSRPGKAIVRHLLTTDEIYGLGDLQYILILSQMKAHLSFTLPTNLKGQAFYDAVLANEFGLK